MTTLDLTPAELLSTTRAVRKRLDLTRPVARELIRDCLELATQAPTGRNRQRWHFVVVTDAGQRRALAELFRQGLTVGSAAIPEEDVRRSQVKPGSMERVFDGLAYLAAHLQDVPVLVIPCISGRTEGAGLVEQAGTWGSILPAVWSFMLAARSHGLGTCWTTPHLHHEREAAAILGIPYERVMQVALIPVAHTLGTDFRPGPRVSIDEVAHWDRW